MSRTALAATALSLAALFAAATTSVAQDQTNPIPGIDIIVKKQPAGGMEVIGSVGANGAFGGSVKLEAGTYVIHTACSKGVRCRPNRLTSLSVDGRRVALTAPSGGTRDFVNQGLITNSNSKLVVVRGTVRVER